MFKMLNKGKVVNNKVEMPTATNVDEAPTMKLSDNDCENISGGLSKVPLFIHGEIKDPVNPGFKAGQMCGGVIRPYSGTVYDGFQCDKCGEFYRHTFWRDKKSMFYSGDCFKTNGQKFEMVGDEHHNILVDYFFS